MADVASEEYVASLRRRLWTLEQKIMGDEAPPDSHSLLDTLDVVKRRLQTFSTKKEEVKAAWQKIPELEAVLKPGYANSVSLSTGAKEEMLLCYTEPLESIGPQVDQLRTLKNCINSLELRGMEAHQKRISSLARTHVTQEETAVELSENVRKFVDAYGKILLQMSSKCVELDDTVTQLEKSVISSNN